MGPRVHSLAHVFVEPCPVDPPESGHLGRHARRSVDQSSQLEEEFLTLLTEEALRHSQMESTLRGPKEDKLNGALRWLQHEGLIRQRSGDGDGQSIHRYELFGLGYHTLVAIDDIQGS